MLNKKRKIQTRKIGKIVLVGLSTLGMLAYLLLPLLS